MTAPLHLAVIQGSTRDGRLGPTVANWLLTHAAARPELTTDLVDLAETPLPTVFPQLGQAPSAPRTAPCSPPCHRAWPPPTPSSW